MALSLVLLPPPPAPPPSPSLSSVFVHCPQKHIKKRLFVLWAIQFVGSYTHMFSNEVARILVREHIPHAITRHHHKQIVLPNFHLHNSYLIVLKFVLFFVDDRKKKTNASVFVVVWAYSNKTNKQLALTLWSSGFEVRSLKGAFSPLSPNARVTDLKKNTWNVKEKARVH